MSSVTRRRFVVAVAYAAAAALGAAGALADRRDPEEVAEERKEPP